MYRQVMSVCKRERKRNQPRSSTMMMRILLFVVFSFFFKIVCLVKHHIEFAFVVLSENTNLQLFLRKRKEEKPTRKKTRNKANVTVWTRL